MIGRTISNRYRVDTQIGIGGMGIVYQAQDTRLGRDVALKVIAPHLVQDQDARNRFLREAQALAGLSHPNIVTVYDLLEDSETNDVFIVMELLTGTSLRKRITDPTRPTFPDMAIQLCRALECAHSSGILHRDIKPENVFVTSDGTIKLMDFGLARLLDSSSVSQSGAVTGTIAYMAPEQLRGGMLDARTDLYSLGILSYEYLCGFTPFAAENPGTILLKHLTEQPPSLRARVPSVSIELESLVMRLLAKDPSARFPSAQILRDQIERMRAGIPIQATGPEQSQSGATSANSSKIPLTVPKPDRGRGRGVNINPHLLNAPRNTWRIVVVTSLILISLGAALTFGETIQRLITGKTVTTVTDPNKGKPKRTKKQNVNKSHKNPPPRRNVYNNENSAPQYEAATYETTQPVRRATRPKSPKKTHASPTLSNDPNKQGDSGKEAMAPDGDLKGEETNADGGTDPPPTSDANP